MIGIDEAVRKGTVHELAEGETLAAIAKRYGVPLRRIMTANRLTDENITDALRVGKRLFIPAVEERRNADDADGSSDQVETQRNKD